MLPRVERGVERAVAGAAVATLVLAGGLTANAMYGLVAAGPAALFAGVATGLAWPGLRAGDARAVAWPVGTAALTVAVGLWYRFATPMGAYGPFGLGDPTAVTLAGALGALVGVYDRRARLRERERRAAAAARAESLATLNGALRHYLRNGLNVVAGYADLLEPHVDGEGRERLDTLRARTERLDTTVEDLGTLTTALEGDATPLEPVELDAALADAVAEFDDARLAGESDATVAADRLLPRALRALFEVVAARAGTPVTVSVTHREDAVVVDVAGPDGEFECDLDTKLAAPEGLPALLLEAVADRYRGRFLAHECDCAHLVLPRTDERPGEVAEASRVPAHTSPTVT